MGPEATKKIRSAVCVARLIAEVSTFAQIRSTAPARMLAMDSWFLQKAAECGRMAQDACRTDADRAQSKQQEHLWLQIADIEERRADAKRVRVALRDAPGK
jgi:hypothetical protein